MAETNQRGMQVRYGIHIGLLLLGDILSIVFQQQREETKPIGRDYAAKELHIRFISGFSSYLNWMISGASLRADFPLALQTRQLSSSNLNAVVSSCHSIFLRMIRHL